MEKGFNLIVGLIVICIILIVLKVTVFATIFDSEELIPGVTDNEIFTEILSNSTLGEYIISDGFTDDVSKIHIESKSEIYGTNETGGEKLFNDCCNNLIGLGMEEDYTKTYPREGRYSGVFQNDTRRIVFHIFDGDKVEEHTGFYLILTVYRGRVI